MTSEPIAEAWHVFGAVLLPGYGQTESLGMGTSLRKDEHDPVHRPDPLASCGRPVADARVVTLDDENKVVPRGEVGEFGRRQ